MVKLLVFGVFLCVLSADRILAQSIVSHNIGSNDNDRDLINELAKRLDVLEAREAQHSRTEVRYQNEMRGLREELEAQQRTIDSLRSENADKQRQIDALRDSIRDVQETAVESGPVARGLTRQSPVRAVAFFAKLSHAASHLNPNETMVFDVVESNEGQAYDNISGLFTAPVSGTYVFSVTVTTFSVFSTHVGFAKNHVRITEVWINGAESAFDSSGQTILLHLKAGEQVSVQEASSEAYVEGTGHSLFAGFLLFADAFAIGR